MYKYNKSQMPVALNDNFKLIIDVHRDVTRQTTNR